jgi:formylglycine-generating enzyme required for sulfatase activity
MRNSGSRKINKNPKFFIMKIFRILHCFVVFAFIVAVCPPAFSQSGPVLGVQPSATINITGTNSGLYAIQATSDLSNSNGWVSAGLVQLPATNYLWTDTSKIAASGQRFYRAVQIATNLVYISPGTFTMGSPTNEALRGVDETQHLVTLSKGFYMDKYLVTQGEYLAVASNNPSQFTGSLNLPVESVSWNDATNYCALRTAEDQAAGLIPTNWGYRLPTESEWEYACRAGTVTAFYLGSELHSQQANFDGTNEYDSVVGNIFNSGGVNLQTTTVVGSYAQNPWGLYDMAGNLLEWCQDYDGQYPAGSVIDPQGPSTGSRHVLRGGSWEVGASTCRSASRSGLTPLSVRSFAGFRVVLAQQ